MYDTVGVMIDAVLAHMTERNRSDFTFNVTHDEMKQTTFGVSRECMIRAISPYGEWFIHGWTRGDTIRGLCIMDAPDGYTDWVIHPRR